MDKKEYKGSGKENNYCQGILESRDGDFFSFLILFVKRTVHLISSDPHLFTVPFKPLSEKQ